MIACPQTTHRQSVPSPCPPPSRPSPRQPPSSNHPFLYLLPLIQKIAQSRLHRLQTADRDDAIQEVVANAFVAYTKLMLSGGEKRAFATPLANFGVRQYWEGRKVGSRTNSRDILAESCRRRRQLKVGSLFRFEADHWCELLLEDRRAGPAEIATIRIDFQNWLNSLAPSYRRFAEMLAMGETTNDVARQFHVTPARVSQIRRFLERSWQQFQEPELSAA